MDFALVPSVGVCSISGEKNNEREQETDGPYHLSYVIVIICQVSEDSLNNTQGKRDLRAPKRAEHHQSHITFLPMSVGEKKGPY
jgi:hypothetical protein